MEKKSEYKELINELNQLSENFPATKDRMVEIAKILLTDHYKYLPRNKNKNGNDEMWKMSEGNKKNLK